MNILHQNLYIAFNTSLSNLHEVRYIFWLMQGIQVCVFKVHD